jgi:hypothetical protein
MKITTPLSTPLIGIQAGMKKFQENTEQLVKNGASDLTAVVGILESERQVQASAKALEVENRIQKTLIDTFA